MGKENTIKLSDYTYDLPEDRIAFQGSNKRDEAKLLYYKNGTIEDKIFGDIIDIIPSNATLYFNNTKVIPARILMTKETGALIEVFLLKPAYSKDIALALESTQQSVWECMIGNAKKWKEGEFLKMNIPTPDGDIYVSAQLINKGDNIVEFSWDNIDISFSQIIEGLGNVPLPPYIKRKISSEDKERYQTVYSKVDGAVAAPTAGLHFTQDIVDTLKQNGVKEEFLTLHVGAGTFMPIKVSEIEDHPMHSETVTIPISVIKSLLKSEFSIAVGTTTVRTLESLYWFGVKLLTNPKARFQIDKLTPYQKHSLNLTKKEAFEAVLEHAFKNDLEEITGTTEIFIFPGYNFKVCNGLITNFHQPGSTLLLLLAAFAGKKWKVIYQHALQNNYRFLSFGDSSFIIP